ncbi:hypothetical protein [Erythrobacter sp. JK5]|uniref:hypothetical protein n=1 Tax=Erythrobacter sp. JK5 TaxID=2829500 RepID=UPI001BA55346|nr:hypothetical protein [Erythrobacter sp. JK5]QUL38736.1 hypothetical protein KDC96_04990 [Erythrobacter sp. JK5]
MPERRATQPGDSAQLCLSCGLCCDGSLFARGEIERASAETWQRRGLDCAESDGRAFFLQRCACLDGTACSLFATGRPAICERFRCVPLRELEAGQKSLERSRETIERAVRLRGEVRSASHAAGVSFRNFLHLKDELAAAFVTRADGSDHDAIAGALVALARFNAFAEAELLPDDEGDQLSKL